MHTENSTAMEANSSSENRLYVSQMPRSSPASAPSAAAGIGPSSPPASVHGMAEKIIIAEPGGSAGRPGKGSACGDVKRRPMNRLVNGTRMPRAMDSPQEDRVHAAP